MPELSDLSWTFSITISFTISIGIGLVLGIIPKLSQIQEGINFKNIKEWNLQNAGLMLIVFGTFTFLMASAGIFVIDDTTMECFALEVSKNPINSTDVHDCVKDGHNLKQNLFFMSFITTIIIITGTILSRN